MKPYPDVDTVYLHSNMWKASDDTFKDLFLDTACIEGFFEAEKGIEML
jgi:hypothetical protein